MRVSVARRASSKDCFIYIECLGDGISQAKGLPWRVRQLPLWFGLLGVIAQLVERLNGIEEVWGSNPHGSMSHKFNFARGEKRMGRGRVCRGPIPMAP